MHEELNDLFFDYLLIGTNLILIRLPKSIIASGLASATYGVVLLLFDVMLASRYGTGSQAGVFHAAYLIPSVLFSIFSGGAVMGAFVPLFVRLGGPERKPAGRAFISAAGVVILGVLVLVATVLFLCAPGLVRIIASGFSVVEKKQMVGLLQIMLPMLVFHGIGSVFCSALVSKRHFVSAGLAPTLLPLTGLFALIIFAPDRGLSAIGFGLLIGSVLLPLVLLPILATAGIFLLGPSAAPAASCREFVRAYFIAALAHAALSAVMLINQAIAGSLSARDLAAFSFGSKLVILVLAFLTTLAANVALPHFSKIAYQGGPCAAWQTVSDLARKFFLPLALVACLWALSSEWIITWLYARNSFSGNDAALVASVQRWFVLQMPFYVIGVICWRMHNALGRNTILVVASLVALAVALIVAWPASRIWGVQAIAAVHSLAILFWATILLAALRRQHIVVISR